MKKYQITLKGGRTDTLSLYADSSLDVLGLYTTFSTAQITFLKEIVYINPNPIYNNHSSYRELKMLISNGQSNKFFALRFFNPSLSKSYIINKIKTLLTLSDKSISSIKGLVYKK